MWVAFMGTKSHNMWLGMTIVIVRPAALRVVVESDDY